MTGSQKGSGARLEEDTSAHLRDSLPRLALHTTKRWRQWIVVEAIVVGGD
jgi:hypothetical protein